MSKVMYDYIENYLCSLIPKDIQTLEQLRIYAEKNNIPIVQRETAQFLKFMINLKKPNKILELGTAIGYSSILMSMYSSNNCKIDTIERNKDMVLMAKQNIKKCGLEENINVIQGDCIDVIKRLHGKYDLIFIDAGKGHYNHFLPECLRLLSNDGVIIADNVLFRGMVASDELVVRRKITIVKRMRKYLKMINEDEKYITSVIPMGDGIAITMRRNINEKA